MSDDPRELAQRMFGRVLRHLRGTVSLREFSQVVHYDYTRLSRAENGAYLPPPQTVEQIDTALGVGRLLCDLRELVEDIGSAGTRTAAAPAVLSSGGEDDGAVMLVLPTPDGGSVRVRISRRDFSKLIAGGALSSVFPGVTPVDADRIPYALTHPTKIDTSTLAYFRRVLAEHYSADKSLGPRRLLGPVLAQINVLDDLRRQTTTDHVDGLLGVLAQYAEMAGWLHQDLGLLDEALAWSRRAADWALVGGDQQMVAYMLVRQANIACLTGDHHAVVLRAAAARKTRDIDPKLTALAAQQEARGHSLLGDHDTAAGLLAEARALLDRHTEVSHPGAPVYLEHYDTATLEEQSAVCLRLAGDIDGSAAILQAQIASLGPEVVRDRGHLTAKLAVTLTHGRSPDPAHAAELGLEAIQAVRQTGSARILRELGDLDQRLQARWADLPAARDIHAALVA